MNLITDPWIPVITQSGIRKKIRPCDIVDGDDPPVRFDIARPDFNGAMFQFVIGIFQTFFIPSDNNEWKNWLNPANRPTAQQIHAVLVKYEYVFNLGGDGPRFMQDMDTAIEKTESKVISGLLIDEPGDQTIKLNKDLFVKRKSHFQLCESMAAIALFSLQLQAPAGGAGHRTGLRGGGPLTTLLIPKKNGQITASIWEVVWSNMIPKDEMDDWVEWDQDPSVVFPWLAPTLTSESNRVAAPKGRSPLLMYWACPRRIRLNYGARDTGVCTISGETGTMLNSYFTQNYGANYVGWQHFLSPHYEKGGEILPLHPNAGGMTYRHWLGWAIGDSDGKTPIIVAKNVALARKGASRGFLARASLWCFGFDMDNMKARGWQESTIPSLIFENAEAERVNIDRLRPDIKGAIAASVEAAFTIRKQVRLAWKIESGIPEGVEKEFWNATEPEFEKMIRKIHGAYDSPDELGDGVPPEVEQQKELWAQRLIEVGLALFDKWAVSGGVEFEDTEKLTKSRRILHSKKYKNQIRNLLKLAEVGS